MTFYRIQNAKGEGPFYPGITRKWIDESIDRPQAPIQEQMKLLRNRKECEFYCYACETVDDLRFWFSEHEYKKLKKLGYFAYKVEADLLARFDRQCLINTEKKLKKVSVPFQLY
jgi:hypothetical protein